MKWVFFNHSNFEVEIICSTCSSEITFFLNKVVSLSYSSSFPQTGILCFKAQKKETRNKLNKEAFTCNLFDRKRERKKYGEKERKGEKEKERERERERERMYNLKELIERYQKRMKGHKIVKIYFDQIN